MRCLIWQTRDGRCCVVQYPVADAICVPGLRQCMRQRPSKALRHTNELFHDSTSCALQAAMLDSALVDKTASLTVLAPVDSAFESIPQADLDALLADKTALTTVCCCCFCSALRFLRCFLLHLLRNRSGCWMLLCYHAPSWHSCRASAIVSVLLCPIAIDMEHCQCVKCVDGSMSFASASCCALDKRD